MKSKKLSQWEKATNELVHEFITKYYNKETSWYWIGDEIGHVIDVGNAEGFHSLETILQALRLECPIENFFEWDEQNNQMYAAWIERDDNSKEPRGISMEYFIKRRV